MILAGIGIRYVMTSKSTCCDCDTNFRLLLPTLGTIGAAIGRVGGVVASTALRNRLIARKLAAMHWRRFVAKPLFISVGVALVCYPLLEVGRPAWVLLLYGTATMALLVVSSGLAPSAIKELMNLPSSRD